MSSRETLEINNVYIFKDSGCLMREKEEMSLIELICGETISDRAFLYVVEHVRRGSLIPGCIIKKHSEKNLLNGLHGQEF